MKVSRLSTHSFALRAAPHLDDPAKFLETLSHPMLRDILETMDAHEAALFFILGPVQFFKSLAGQLRLARNHALRPRKTGWYAPTDDFQKKFASGKINPLLEALPDIDRLQFTKGAPILDRETGQLLNADKNKVTTLAGSYVGGARHFLLSAQKENDRTGITLEDIYIDEPHRYEYGALKQIFNRADDYQETATFTLMSTGMVRGVDTIGAEAAQVWDTTDGRLWHSRCPNCRKFFEPRNLHREKPDDRESPIIGGLIYDRLFLPNSLPNVPAIIASIRYKCPRCGTEKLPDTAATRTAMNGTYAHPIGIYACQHAAPKPNHVGWTFSAIAGRIWWKIAERFELAMLARARGDLEPLSLVVREEFGGIWNPTEYLKEKRTRPPGGYKMADLKTWGRTSADTPWKKELTREHLRAWWPAAGFDGNGDPYLIAAIDVHQDWFRLVVRAWNRLSQSRLLYTDTVLTAGRLVEILDALGVRRDRTVIDERHKPQQVRMWAANFGWRTLQGEGKEKDFLHPDKVRRVISPPEFIDPFQGSALQGQAKIIKNYFAKWSCLARLILLRQHTANDGTPLFTAADDAPDYYFIELDDYTGIPKVEDNVHFIEYASTGNDHSADDEMMIIAVASALNLTGAESLIVPTEEKPATETP